MTLSFKKCVTIAALASVAGCGLHGKPTVDRKSATSTSPGGPGRSPAMPPREIHDGDTVVAPGIVEPWGGPIEIAARESGWIAEIAVAEGATVSAGQLLAKLEDGAQRHALELARAELAEARSALAKLERGATQEELQQAEAEREAAQVRANLARSGAARSARLHAQRVVSDSDDEHAASDAKAEAALANRADARLQELQRGARQEDREAARARVDMAMARVRLAEANLARRWIEAPGPGTILLSRFHVGEFCTTGAGPLFVLGDTTRLQVRLEVDEIDAAALEAGLRSVVRSDAGARLVDGVVVRLAPRMGRRTLPTESPTSRNDVRVREVFVEISADSGLIPGQRVWGHTSRSATARSARPQTSEAG